MVRLHMIQSADQSKSDKTKGSNAESLHYSPTDKQRSARASKLYLAKQSPLPASSLFMQPMHRTVN